MDRVLVVEDDRAVQKALLRLFEGEEYSVEVAPDGTAGLERFRARHPSAVVLDLRLPGLAGQDVCRKMKELAPTIPIIILSAKTEVTDKVLLLELGADDYVTKPFSPRELLARVRAAIRRSGRTSPTSSLAFGDVVLDFDKMELTRAGEERAKIERDLQIVRTDLTKAHRELAKYQARLDKARRKPAKKSGK